MIDIRQANPLDYDQIWSIIAAVIAKGDTYSFYPDSTREEMLGYWCAEDKHTYVATIEKEIVATFIIKPNNVGLSSHIANASYMVKEGKFGLGIGQSIGAFSLIEAKRIGFVAMQFNLVIKTNTRAVKLWQDLGFDIIGQIPEAFQHKTLGLVDAYIMYRKL